MAEANVPEVEASGRTTPPGVANKLRYGTKEEFCGEEESEGSSIMNAHVLDKDWCSETEADQTPAERSDLSENSGEAEAMLEFENNQQLLRKNKELQKKVEKLKRSEITAKKDLAEIPWLNQKLQEEEEKRRALEEEVDVTLDENVSLKNRVSKLSNQVLELFEENDSLTEQGIIAKEDDMAEISSLKQKLREEEEKRKGLEEDVEVTHDENISLKARLSKLSNQLFELDEENESLREQEITAKKEEHFLKKESQSLRELAELREKELVSLGAKMNKMYSRLSTMEQEIQEMREKNDQMASMEMAVSRENEKNGNEDIPGAKCSGNGETHSIEEEKSQEKKNIDGYVRKEEESSQGEQETSQEKKNRDRYSTIETEKSQREEKEAAQTDENNRMIVAIDSKIDGMSETLSNAFQQIITIARHHTSQEVGPELFDRITALVKEKHVIQEEVRKQRKKRKALQLELKEKNKQLLAQDSKMAEMAKLIEDLQDSGTDKSNLVYRLRETEKQVGEEKRENFRLFTRLTLVTNGMDELVNEKKQCPSTAATPNLEVNNKREDIHVEQPNQRDRSLSGPGGKWKKRINGVFGFLRRGICCMPKKRPAYN